eukprot:CAMPEP_0206059412 /NCGR_PEP_ID=MMETSP1466-20131121/48945_1 /ASSEMBLY_ACC=CAM_ASM_001126 /TAXON_ID=44452 /ORGANISM="Pavlova gyrans, Strain CCMP608" /LENGTH=154 /DNA_ID=CAMNT_0053434735 /DNA_START=370 /DNA_END=829 /DNA_ORIENTATION=-
MSPRRTVTDSAGLSGMTVSGLGLALANGSTATSLGLRTRALLNPTLPRALHRLPGARALGKALPRRRAAWRSLRLIIALCAPHAVVVHGVCVALAGAALALVDAIDGRAVGAEAAVRVRHAAREGGLRVAQREDRQGEERDAHHDWSGARGEGG